MDEEHFWALSFKSCHRFSVGFRSGPWLDLNTSVCLDRIHSIAHPTLCFYAWCPAGRCCLLLQVAFKNLTEINRVLLPITSNQLPCWTKNKTPQLPKATTTFRLTFTAGFQPQLFACRPNVPCGSPLIRALTFTCLLCPYKACIKLPLSLYHTFIKTRCVECTTNSSPVVSLSLLRRDICNSIRITP